MNRRLNAAMGLAGAVTLVAASCAKAPTDDTTLQTSDLTSVGVPFSANEIVSIGSFTDDGTITASAVQQFFEKTPYGQASFLATYSSHGVRADEAIALSAQKYALNPLVFLARAEMNGGLVGLTAYPSDPSRVEYAFGCGCANGGGDCDPALAGFDVQVDCLASALRESLDAVAASGHTDGGWGPGIATTTLDGVRVTPADASTAALYQYTPLVNKGQSGGNWLFWNLWEKYASALGYQGAVNTPTNASIGDACTSSGQCAFTGGVCATNYPGGLCTASCTGTCPTDHAGTQSFCADFGGQGGFCLPVCNPSASACRTGYSCQRVAEFGDAGAGQYVCSPG